MEEWRKNGRRGFGKTRRLGNRRGRMEARRERKWKERETRGQTRRKGGKIGGR